MKSEINFPSGSPEEMYLSIVTSISPLVLSLPHNTFTYVLKDDDLIFHLSPAMARQLGEDGIIEDESVNEISYIDIVLSPYETASFDYMRSYAAQLTVGKYTVEEDELKLLAYLSIQFYNKKFSALMTIEGLDRPIPTQAFLNILNKNLGMEVFMKKDDVEYAGKLRYVRIQRTMFSIYISVELGIVSKGKEGYVQGSAFFSVPFVKMAKVVEDLGITQLTAEDKARFTERGEKYMKHTQRPSYCVCTGFAYRPGRMGDIRLRSNGRVMIDINAMRMMNSWLGDNWYTGRPFDGNSPSGDISKDSLWMCSPVVFGFSFTTKTWMRMHIEDISPIVFSEVAFDELIIPEKDKDMFVSCLTNEMPSLDSIEGKGNGKIFLLFGSPGVGKTMTAEAIAEYLKLPLYYVSVGELGVSPEAMEESLTDILEVSSSWSAVVLLDEVDVFAMKRDGSDIQRNAMTAILLRLLERYSGIMFMTTNLRDNLDEAFISRALCSIHYEELTVSDRTAIWSNLLRKIAAFGIKIGDDVHDSVPTFAQHPMNGREIKNRLRLAYSMAAASVDKKLTTKIISSVISYK